jgi:cobalt-zinc-cadmium efflux system outer membrane protein|tara:strand:- start:479 stop:1771 length:1293 start_codon:yes stop_codon:yes gene_type:complete
MKLSRYIILAGFVCYLFAQKAQATPSPIVAELMREAVNVDTKNLSALIQETTKNNPTIRAAHDRWVAETHVIPQARSLPDPVLIASYFTLDGNKGEEKVLQGLELLGGSQEIPFPGKLYKRWKIAKINASKMDAEYLAVTISIISQLKRKYYDLYFVNKSIEILKHNQALLEILEHKANEKYGSHHAPEQDVFRAKTELARFEMRLVSLQQEQQSLITDINNIVNRDLDINITTPHTLPITPFEHKAEELNDGIKQRSPHLNVRRKNAEKAKESIALNKMAYFADFELEAEHVKDKAIGAVGYQVVLKATLPLYFFDKQNKAVRESVARYHADLEDFQDTYQELGYRVQNAFLIIHRTNKLIKLLESSLLPQAKEALTSSQVAYRTGGVDFLTMLNNLLTLQENEVELEGEIVKHEKQITEIEEVLGIFL